MIPRFTQPKKRFGLALVVFGLALSAARAADADEYDAAFARAIAAKERALDKNDPANWQDALELFEQADRIRSTKEAKYELGTAAARLRQDDLAVEAYEAALELGLAGTAADKARSFVTEKSAEMARLELAGAEGARVFVGERARAILPLVRPLVVFAGKRNVRATLGEQNRSVEVVLKPGEKRAIDLSFTAAARNGPGPTPPGPRADGTPPTRPDRTQEPADRTVGWSLALGGAGLAVAGGAAVLAASSSLRTHRNRLAELCRVQDGSDGCVEAEPGKRAEAQDEADSIATMKAVRIGGYVGLGVGIVSAGIGTILLVGSGDERKSHGRPAHSASVFALPGGAGVAFGGPL